MMQEKNSSSAVPDLAELRDQAGETLQRAAAWLRVSVAHLSNCERHVARLAPDQDAALRAFYFSRINDRIGRLSDALGESGPAETRSGDNQDRAADLGPVELMSLLEWELRHRPRALGNIRREYTTFCQRLYHRLRRARRAR